MNNKKSYEYPIEYDWDTEEITKVINFYNMVESIYEKGVDKKEFINSYNEFRKIVPMKMDQNNLSKRFEKESGYSIYKSVKEVQRSTGNFVKF
ncbi:UPF0223 family protein [Companilactobacillus sp. DQM5]|uniref:UPF0223 family protein n=1 Tax=Companilactobacillus sp. DQM5 TaxID=3463359 RepID=UPI004058A54E